MLGMEYLPNICQAKLSTDAGPAACHHPDAAKDRNAKRVCRVVLQNMPIPYRPKQEIVIIDDEGTSKENHQLEYAPSTLYSNTDETLMSPS